MTSSATACCVRRRSPSVISSRSFLRPPCNHGLERWPLEVAALPTRRWRFRRDPPAAVRRERASTRRRWQQETHLLIHMVSVTVGMLKWKKKKGVVVTFAMKYPLRWQTFASPHKTLFTSLFCKSTIYRLTSNGSGPTAAAKLILKRLQLVVICYHTLSHHL